MLLCCRSSSIFDFFSLSFPNTFLQAMFSLSTFLFVCLLKKLHLPPLAITHTHTHIRMRAAVASCNPAAVDFGLAVDMKDGFCFVNRLNQ